MTPRTRAEPPDSLVEGRGDEAGADSGPPDLGGLPVAGLGRRRLLQLTTLIVAGWLSFAFLRQVGDVTAASARADTLRAANSQLAGEVAALEDELRLIQRQEYVAQQARAFRLGSPREVPFTLGQPAPSLGPDAPGSAGVRVGAETDARSPLDAWLSLLFGPGRSAD